jgi:hypothetical protein
MTGYLLRAWVRCNGKASGRAIGTDGAPGNPRHGLGAKTAVVAALLGNAAVVVLKAVTAAMTGSAAMLAETFHSIADTGNQVLLFVGIRLSERPPDRAHPFGHGMNTYFWAFVVSAMLFTLGGAVAIGRRCTSSSVPRSMPHHRPRSSCWPAPSSSKRCRSALRCTPPTPRAWPAAAALRSRDP